MLFNLLKALVDVKRELTYCSVCGHITENDPCYICQDKQRDRSVICVVEDDKDVIAMEKMREYKGLYHVLHGSISPMDGIGPEDINIPALVERLKVMKLRTYFSNESQLRGRIYSNVYFEISEANWY